MKENGWVIEAFPFNYKKTKYIVLARLYQKSENKPKYALLKTEIIKEEDHNISILIPVNSNGFMTDAKTLREFFNIDYSENLGDILQQFNKHFANFIPTDINPQKSESLKNTMISSLSKSDSEDPNKKYCYTVKRNANKGERSPFNDNKTKLLRPELYLRFKDDSTISFCYSQNISDEKTDEEILLKFSMRD
jgi:hypothetical protein